MFTMKFTKRLCKIIKSTFCRNGKFGKIDSFVIIVEQRNLILCKTLFLLKIWN